MTHDRAIAALLGVTSDRLTPQLVFTPSDPLEDWLFADSVITDPQRERFEAYLKVDDDAEGDWYIVLQLSGGAYRPMYPATYSIKNLNPDEFRQWHVREVQLPEWVDLDPAYEADDDDDEDEEGY